VLTPSRSATSVRVSRRTAFSGLVVRITSPSARRSGPGHDHLGGSGRGRPKCGDVGEALACRLSSEQANKTAQRKRRRIRGDRRGHFGL
jgi:hypothetical protein